MGRRQSVRDPPPANFVLFPPQGVYGSAGAGAQTVRRRSAHHHHLPVHLQTGGSVWLSIEMVVSSILAEQAKPTPLGDIRKEAVVQAAHRILSRDLKQL